MRDSSWLGLVDSLLRPARPLLARCAEEREKHLLRTKESAERRLRAIADCELRIRLARAVVFAADDGVVTKTMTALEREWRQLSRVDRDGGIMDLWSRIAPPAWIDRKLWRSSAPASQLDAAVALASDPDGIDAAERAARALATSLRAWRVPIGSRIDFRAGESDVDTTTDLLAPPFFAACTALASFDGAAIVVERARLFEREVHDAVLTRHPERPCLARSVAYAAFVDTVCRAAALEADLPTAALRDLWATGYALAAIDANGIVIAIR